jgi:hypothetical protein
MDNERIAQLRQAYMDAALASLMVLCNLLDAESPEAAKMIGATRRAHEENAGRCLSEFASACAVAHGHDYLIEYG